MDVVTILLFVTGYALRMFNHEYILEQVKTLILKGTLQCSHYVTFMRFHRVNIFSNFIHYIFSIFSNLERIGRWLSSEC